MLCSLENHFTILIFYLICNILVVFFALLCFRISILYYFIFMYHSLILFGWFTLIELFNNFNFNVYMSVLFWSLVRQTLLGWYICFCITFFVMHNHDNSGPYSINLPLELYLDQKESTVDIDLAESISTAHNHQPENRLYIF